MSYFKQVIRDASKAGASLTKDVREFIKKLPKSKRNLNYEEKHKNN